MWFALVALVLIMIPRCFSSEDGAYTEDNEFGYDYR